MSSPLKTRVIEPEASDPAPLAPTELDPSVMALLACPACLAGLRASAGHLKCDGCGRSYPLVDGIPVLIPGRATPAQGV